MGQSDLRPGKGNFIFAKKPIFLSGRDGKDVGRLKFTGLRWSASSYHAIKNLQQLK